MNIKTIGMILLIAVLALALIAWNGAQVATPAEPRTISVTGEAEVRVVPDEVVITVGVETINKDLDKAKKENDTYIAQVIAVTQAHGIEAKHVQTDYLNIESRYQDSYEKRGFIGYVVRRNAVITLRDLDQFESLLGDLLKGGANTVHGIQFRTSELRKYRDQARELALKAAQEKAVSMAGVLEQQIGDPLVVVEEQSGWYGWYGAWWGARGGSAMTQNVVQNVEGSTYLGQDSTLAPGQIAITARVAVQFELK
ncbi:MAG: SIMPL domain-containing protein [Anaerolineae bacterium]|nr:SIMPL domain-containing protein [Anaerolineae bacterium]